MRLGREEIRDRLRPLLEERLPEECRGGAFAEDLGLLGRGIGLDSIEALEIVGRIEQEFGITVADHDLERRHFESVGRLVSFIEERVG